MVSIYEILNRKRTITIGSSPENDVVFSDPQTSPRHCQISIVNNGVYLITDLNSASGTFINGHKMPKGFAYDNDLIKVGDNVFRLGEKIDEQDVMSTEQNLSDKPLEPVIAPAVKPKNIYGSSSQSNDLNKPSGIHIKPQNDNPTYNVFISY